MKQRNSEQAYQLLYEAIASLKNSEETQAFFEDLCTPAELQAMADRWLVVNPLKEAESYRKIHEKTGVSVTTIGRVARHLTQGAGGYELVYKRLSKRTKDGRK